MCAKYYENPTMLSKVTAKNVGDVFFWDTLYIPSQSPDWFKKTRSFQPITWFVLETKYNCNQGTTQKTQTTVTKNY